MANEYVANRGGLDGFTSDPDRFSRQAVGLHLGAPFVKTSGAQVRGGVLGSGLGYTATTGLSATLSAGVYLLPTSADIGPVEVVVPSNQTFTHDTAHASQPRADLIIVEVVDNGDNTSTKKVRILKGTAGSGSPDPTLPSSLGNGAVVAIHRVLIPAASSTLSTTTDLRTYTGAATVVLDNSTSASTLPEGTIFYSQATDAIGWKTAAGTETITGASVLGARKWYKLQSVPTASANYGFGDLRSAAVTLGTYGTAPATVIGTPNYESLVISATGWYDVDVAVFATSAPTAYVRLSLPDETRVTGVDAQGRGSITRLGVPLSAGATITADATHTDGGSKNIEIWITIVRRA